MAPPATTIVMATDDGEILWTPVTEKHVLDSSKHDTSDLICDGHLFGPAKLTARVRDILSEFGPTSVHVNYWAQYTFTDGRDTLPDVVAAMVSCGNGRGLLNEVGWEVLENAMPELTDPENNRDDVIY